MEPMSLLAWIVIGVLAGYLASRVMPSSFGLLVDSIIGMFGAFVGSWVFNQFGGQGTTGFSVWSLLVSFVGALVIFIAIYIVRQVIQRPA